jgi:hypothetical protein
VFVYKRRDGPGAKRSDPRTGERRDKGEEDDRRFLIGRGERGTGMLCYVFVLVTMYGVWELGWGKAIGKWETHGRDGMGWDWMGGIGHVL